MNKEHKKGTTKNQQKQVGSFTRQKTLKVEIEKSLKIKKQIIKKIKEFLKDFMQNL